MLKCIEEEERVKFREEVRRQSMLLEQSEDEQEVVRWIEDVAPWAELE